jgi:lipoyl(octanoyl) transferase
LQSDGQSIFNESNGDKIKLEVYDLGVIPYSKCLELQRTYHRKLIEGTQGDVLLTCSHPPVITCGTSTEESHFYMPTAEIEATGTSVVNIERGGSVTYHGPEQAVVYPLIDLHNHKTDVGWYMRSLEEVVMRTLQDYGITGIRVPGKTGVWIDENSKIAFSGVRISRWCTLHGFSLNVLPCAERFKPINPCGLGDISILSISELIAPKAVTVPEVTHRLISHFLDIFNYEV